MRSREIQRLINAVEQVHGSIKLYGSNEQEEEGTCFIIQGIPATFSVLSLEGALPSDRFDIQIEEHPPDRYLYNLELCSIDKFVEIIERFKSPKKDWPQGN